MLGALLISALLAQSYPPQLDSMLQVRHENGAGFAIPLPGGQALTVAHVLPEESQIVTYIAPNNQIGGLTVIWLDQDIDLAMLQSNKAFTSTIKISDKLPEVNSEVFYKILLGDVDSISWTSGKVLGIDNDGDLLIDGWFAPGASGSGILNKAGELVGIVQAGMNISSSPPKIGLDEAINLSRIFKRTSFPPCLAARPIIKSIPKKPDARN